MIGGAAERAGDINRGLEMDSNEYIKNAVLLADGWDIDNCESGDPDYDYISFAGGGEWHYNEDPMWIADIPEIFLDALAAQLTRQVDAVILFDIRVREDGVEMWQLLEASSQWEMTKTQSPDRTMNTIKAIIDSKVLNTDGLGEGG